MCFLAASFDYIWEKIGDHNSFRFWTRGRIGLEGAHVRTCRHTTSLACAKRLANGSPTAHKIFSKVRPAVFKTQKKGTYGRKRRCTHPDLCKTLS